MSPGHYGYIDEEIENKKETIQRKVKKLFKRSNYNKLVNIERIIDNIDDFIDIVDKIKYKME